MKNMLKTLGIVLILGLIMTLSGCSGDDGSNGTNGTDGASSPLADPTSVQYCGVCHTDKVGTWTETIHADSQQNAPELAGDVGHSPEEQIADEDCISCHSPQAVQANGGMTEAEALGYFYTTATTAGTADDGTPYDVGDFYPGTVPAHATEWPNIACQTCHSQTQGMTSNSMLNLALFDSHYIDPATGTQGVEKPVTVPNELCGQCHGSLHVENQGTDDTFAGGSYSDWSKWTAANPTLAGNWKGTNHLLHDGWKLSKHGNTQLDPAAELASDYSGETPAAVVASENCIACHAPTAVLANGGMTEAQAMDYFFTTTSGAFDATTVAKNAAEWPNVDCVACHDPHTPGSAYFNSSTQRYEPMASTEELCGQCHGDLRFADTDHLSYNILQGTGGMGVADQPGMGATCTECHMAVNSTTWPGEHHFNQYMTHGHTWQIIVNGGDKGHHPENHPDWSGWSLGAFVGDMTLHADETANSGNVAGNGDNPHMASCTQCHATMDATAAQANIDSKQSAFAVLDATTQTNVASATTAMAGNTDPTLVANLEEAQFNLQYADSDESGGFHNHTYLMALLSDANTKALAILSALSPT